MKRLCWLLIIVLGVISLAYADTTYRFNGLTTSQVLAALGQPDSRKTYTSLGEEVWTYGSVVITFKNGKISWCDIPCAALSSIDSSCSYVATSSGSIGKIYGSGLNSVSTGTKTAQSYMPTWPLSSTSKTSSATEVSRRGLSVSQYGVGSSKERIYLGKLSVNPYDSESISNPYGRYGSPYGDNLMNPYSRFGSQYSHSSWRNPYATNTPKIYAADGTYLGKLSSNRYDPESISNPYGRYGNSYGNTINNPYSKYGSPYSSYSWRNPYSSTAAPRIYWETR